MPHRRSFLRLTMLAALAPLGAGAGEYLPLRTTFIGDDRYRRLMQRAEREGWSRLPIGERVARAGLAMVGTPYEGFTLEIDDHVESPSVNLEGLDCWTFFETALAIGRLTGRPNKQHSKEDLLRAIETTRYRGGACHGNYLDRIHYLDEWFRDNDRRGHVDDITATLGPTVLLEGRRIDEMTVLWKSYRYLRNNPGLREGMAKMEAELQTHPFRYIPAAAVAGIEPRLRSGDIIGIVTRKPHVYCSHVGLFVRTQDGAPHFMHASSTKHRVMVDTSVAGYLAQFSSHAGIVVARPREP